MLYFVLIVLLKKYIMNYTIHYEKEIRVILIKTEFMLPLQHL